MTSDRRFTPQNWSEATASRFRCSYGDEETNDVIPDEGA
jgi:hypothetical protein